MPERTQGGKGKGHMLETREWETLNEMIAALYGIKDSKTTQKAFLTRLMRLIDFDFADFNLAESGEKQDSWLREPVTVSVFDQARERSFVKGYETQYYKKDYVGWIFAQPKSMVYRESDLISETIRKESSFYKDYLSKYDLGSVAGISIISAGRLVGAVTLYKSETRGDFSRRDLYILEILLPHLQNVLESHQAQEKNEQEEVRQRLKYRYRITKKEMDVIRLLLQGKSNHEIAAELGTSPNTVKCQVSSIFGKTEVKSRTQLICFLIQNRLLELG